MTDCCVCYSVVSKDDGNRMDCIQCNSKVCGTCIQSLIKLKRNYVSCPVCRYTNFKFYFNIVLQELVVRHKKQEFIQKLIEDSKGMLEYRKISNELRVKREGLNNVVRVGHMEALKFYHRSINNIPLLLLLERMPQFPNHETEYYFRVYVSPTFCLQNFSDQTIGIGDLILQGSRSFNRELNLFLRPCYTYEDMLDEIILMTLN